MTKIFFCFKEYISENKNRFKTVSLKAFSNIRFTLFIYSYIPILLE